MARASPCSGARSTSPKSPIEIVALMRQVVARTVKPDEAVKAYHGELQKQKIKPARALADDLRADRAAAEARGVETPQELATGGGATPLSLAGLRNERAANAPSPLVGEGRFS